MTGNLKIHPPRETLLAYGLGKLDATESVAVEAHIDECEECCETLLGMDGDTFVEIVRRSGPLQDASPAVPRTVGLDQADNETVCSLPVALADHPRYRVIELLGKGGMGNVFKAEHTLMNRAVALKVINPELVQNALAVERFRREVRSAAQLAHPNIVTAHDAEQAGDIHLLVMEFVQGDNLADVVKREGPLDVAVACDCIWQAAQGLQHAHEHGMVHRDIKPHNLMVTGKGQIKILDFGLAALANESIIGDADNLTDAPDTVSNLTSAGSIMGTPDFISPEQGHDASNVDVRSDIYSLGCTFYYLLTGQPPFTVGSAMERVKAHEETDPEAIENVRVDIPEELANVVKRMMAKDAARRFQTPAEVADALSFFVDAHRSTPPQSGVTNRSAVSDKRSWWPPTVVQSLIYVAFAFILAGVIYVATDNGTLVVESDDDHVEIIIRAASGLRMVDTLTGTTAKRLRRGEYAVELKGDDNDFELSQDRFELKRGDKVVVSITRKEDGDGDVDVPTPNSEFIVRKAWADAKDNTGGPSPDGRYITFVDWDTGDVAVWETQTRKNRRLTNKGSWQQSNAFALYPCFSADSKLVAYTWFDHDGNSSVRIVDLEGQ